MAGRKVTVFALVKAKPGMEETVKQELSALVRPTRDEQGCINYDLHQSLVKAKPGMEETEKRLRQPSGGPEVPLASGEPDGAPPELAGPG